MDETQKNNSNLIVVVLIIIAILAVVYFFVNQGDSPSNQPIATNTETNDNDVTDSSGGTDDVMTEDETVVLHGEYSEYTAEKVARADGNDVVLFFHASWCPTCKALDGNIVQNIERSPETLTILKVNYDTATELRKKYGVTTQHTLVQVNASGELVKKWTGSPSLESVLSQVE